MTKAHLSLHATEAAVLQAAATIYAAYIQRGMVHAGHETEWRERSLDEAVELARIACDEIQADAEFSQSPR